jgi:hypothetical protein
MSAAGDVPAAAAFVIEVCRRSWKGRTRSSIPVRRRASRNVFAKRTTSKAVPFVGEQKTRSSSPTNRVRRRFSKSSAARRGPSEIVLSPASDFGVSTPYRTHVSATRRYGPSGSAR